MDWSSVVTRGFNEFKTALLVMDRAPIPEPAQQILSLILYSRIQGKFMLAGAAQRLHNEEDLIPFAVQLEWPDPKDLLRKDKRVWRELPLLTTFAPMM